MRHADSAFFPLAEPKTQIIFAAGQLQGGRHKQEDVFLNFGDECFVVADGVGGLPHGDVAARLAAETAIWGYKHIRLRPYYWADKKLFIKRIFRSVNIAVWQKHRETEFIEGLASTLVVLILSTRKMWLGSVGDSSAFLFRKGTIKKLTHDDIDDFGNLTKVVGLERFGLVPQFVALDFEVGDVVLLTTDGVGNFVSQDELKDFLSSTGSTKESLMTTIAAIFDRAKTNGSLDNLTACLIKRVLTKS